MHHHSNLTNVRLVVRHHPRSVIGRLLSTLPAPIRRITSLLVLAVAGSAHAATGANISLTVSHLEYGLDYPEYGFFPNGFDHLIWSAPPAERFSVSQTILGQTKTLTTTVPGNRNSSGVYLYEAIPAPRGQISTYYIMGYTGNLEAGRSPKTWCGELLANGGFRPELGDLYWTQATNIPFHQGRLIKQNGDGTFFGQLGGVENARESLATITATAVPIPEFTTFARTLQFLGKARCDTTESLNAVYDSLTCVITNANTGAILYTTHVLCSNVTHGDWFEFGENLPYDLLSGKNLRLTFVAQNDYSLPTTFYLKDITLNVSVLFR